jgi:hypothetical protein
VLNEVAVRVSPPEGTRGVKVTRSVLREPTMVIVLDIVGYRWREGEKLGGREVCKNMKVSRDCATQ